ncbi:MAG: hypothetical protein JSS51_00440 [Planctomycetes bacterium]|nr:hypothetical protein [Planctomycetota bacterium]
MTTAGSVQSPPRALYGLLMAGFVALGALAAYAVGLRGSADSANLAAMAVLLAGFLGLIPAVLRLRGGMQTWGLLVFGAGMARMLALLAIAVYFSMMREVVKQPFWLGVVSGGVIVLVLETVAAFVILNRFESARVRQPGAGAAQASGSSTES